jgi:flagellar motor switch protein FliN/FliY
MKLERIQDAMVPIQVMLGGAMKKVIDVAGIGEGTIIELDKLAGEPVDLLAAGELIAKGEVVVIDENFGVRVTKIVKREA